MIEAQRNISNREVLEAGIPLLPLITGEEVSSNSFPTVRQIFSFEGNYRCAETRDVIARLNRLLRDKTYEEHFSPEVGKFISELNYVMAGVTRDLVKSDREYLRAFCLEKEIFTVDEIENAPFFKADDVQSVLPSSMKYRHTQLLSKVYDAAEGNEEVIGILRGVINARCRIVPSEKAPTLLDWYTTFQDNFPEQTWWRSVPLRLFGMCNGTVTVEDFDTLVARYSDKKFDNEKYKEILSESAPRRVRSGFSIVSMSAGGDGTQTATKWDERVTFLKKMGLPFPTFIESAGQYQLATIHVLNYVPFSLEQMLDPDFVCWKTAIA